jgi:hypothetical protein
MAAAAAAASSVAACKVPDAYLTNVMWGLTQASGEYTKDRDCGGSWGSVKSPPWFMVDANGHTTVHTGYEKQEGDTVYFVQPDDASKGTVDFKWETFEFDEDHEAEDEHSNGHTIMRRMLNAVWLTWEITADPGWCQRSTLVLTIKDDVAGCQWVFASMTNVKLASPIRATRPDAVPERAKLSHAYVERMETLVRYYDTLRHCQRMITETAAALRKQTDELAHDAKGEKLREVELTFYGYSNARHLKVRAIELHRLIRAEHNRGRVPEPAAASTLSTNVPTVGPTAAAAAMAAVMPVVNGTVTSDVPASAAAAVVNATTAAPVEASKTKKRKRARR